VNYKKYFKYAGLDLVNKNKGKKEVHLGMSTRWEDGKLKIRELDKQYGAYISGLNVDDEIVAIDRYRVNKEFGRLFEKKNVGDSIDVMINRQGVIMEMKVDLTQNRQVDYELVPVKRPGKLAQQIRKSWLGS